ncbi:MAG: alpha/beta hydrolase, partial [Nitriliruptor sp.]|uniref:alpha/beta fold hydrolase n=1 Tax=Nitriliruptor sp. TaxID=2448056 RepID=UPI0034A04453
MTNDAPDWFTAALADPGEPGEVVVSGARIGYLTWGERDAPTLVLVHGGAAHAGWWAPLAPLLARDHRVVALDLSGHGGSDHRDDYSVETWAEEVMAVAGVAGGVGRPTVVGHSMGGFVTIVVAATRGAELHGAVVLDSPVLRPDPETEEASRTGRNLFRAPKTYPDLETAVDHFHLVPPQPRRHPWLIDHIARASLREVATDEGSTGWTWKFDPLLFVTRSGPRLPSEYGPQLAQAACRLAVVTGERSAIVDDDVIDHMRELVAGSPAAAAGVPFVRVPDAHHHLLLDEPLATVTALRAILATWSPVGTG